MKYKKSIVCLLLIYASEFSVLSAQTLPEYWGNLQSGNYAVGFKSICVYDTTRKYDLTCGDTTVLLKNKNAGRPILMNIWYPAVKDNTPALKVKDFFDFPTNENTQYFFSKLHDFQYKNSKLYAVEQNIKKNDFSQEGDTSLSGRDRKRTIIFENYIHANTISHRNAVTLEGDFPIIIYHQGLGGTIDENYLLLEYLASHGYIVINSAFQVQDGSGYDEGFFLGVGDYDATFADFTFIINYCKRNNISRSKKVFLSGHSYGANCSITYIGEGNQNVDGLVPLDSDYGYVLSDFFPKKYNPFINDKIKFYNALPIFCVGRGEAHYRMLDSLSQSKRYFLTISEMMHNDFTAQGSIGRFYCIPYVVEKEKFGKIHANYLNMCASILKYMDSYCKGGKELEKKDIIRYKGWKLEASKEGEKSSLNSAFNPSKKNCPSVSQFLDIVNNKGLKERTQVCNMCPDTALKAEMVSDIFDFLFENGDSLQVLPYLQWMEEMGFAKKNLYNIYFTVFYLSFLDSGNGFHYKKAVPIYQWMIDKYPKGKYGYLGMALFVLYTGEGNPEVYCKKVVETDPDYLKIRTDSFWDERSKEMIKKCLGEN